MQRKLKFKIGNLRNTENFNVTSHQVHKKRKKREFLPWRSCRKANAIDKGKSLVGHESNYTFFFSHTTLRANFFFFNLIVNVLMFCQTNTFSRFFSLILIRKFDGTLSFKRPLNFIFKTAKSILSGTSCHFRDTTFSIEQNLPFTKLAQDFCSFIILRT